MLGSLIQRLSLATPPCRHSRESGNPVQCPSFKRAFLDACFRRHDTVLLMHQAGVKGCPYQGRSCVTSVSIVLMLMLCPALAAAQSVFAAASLSSALSELATHYEGMYLSVASSSTLAKQIAAGAPADIYFSANAEWMDYLQARQHIEQDTRVDLLGNALVVIAHKETPFAVHFAREFDFAGAFAGRLALGDPDHVPAGQYARQALEKLGWWPALKNRIAPAPDVRAALVYVERGECAAGLVYATDATQSDRVITLATVPDSLHRPIVYPAAIVKGRASAQTRSLLEFFSSDTAAVIFRKHGFTFLGD